MSNFSFGTPTTTASAPAFGSTQAPATGGFGLGATFGASAAPAAQPTAQAANPGLNFSFGGQSTSTAQSSQPGALTLGGGIAPNTSLFPTSTQQSTGLGQPAQSNTLNFNTAASKPAGLSFGATTTTTTASTGLTFGNAATTGGLTFGTATSGATTGGLSFGATPSSGGLSFGTSSATPASSTATLSFGNAATTTGSSLFGNAGGGLFGPKSLTTTAPAKTTTVTTSQGLGGLDVSINNKGLAQGSTNPTAAKENLLPNEIMQTIEGFKEFVKTQKSHSSDIARGSVRPLHRCAEDTASLVELLTTLVGSVQRDRQLADKLKQDTAKALQNAEIAQRTHDTPGGLQYENNAPLLFFMELAENFENDLMSFKSQIEITEKHIQTMMTPKAMTPQELTIAMKKLHESLVAVAGKLQGVHSQVQQQKEQYLNFRKYVLKDSTNVFEDVHKTDGKSSRSSIGKLTSGPTPFGPGNRNFLSSTALNSVQTPSYNTSNPLAWGNVSSTPSNNLSMSSAMKPPNTGLNFNPPSNLTAPLSSSDASSNFQLQKPPVGNKRGKH